MKRYGFVFARGGSKGIPGKNIRELAGKPLLAWAIEAGRETGLLDDLIVSTDSPQIAEVARKFGARVPFMRPAELAADNSPELLSWKHAVAWLRENGEEFDTFVSLPATAPLRTAADIARCICEFEENDCDLVLTCQDAQRHPMFNMYTQKEDGFFQLYGKTDLPVIRRQDAPPAYDGTTMAYVTSPEYILSCSWLWDGRVRAVKFPRERAIDIDEPLDFEIAEMLLKKRLSA